MGGCHKFGWTKIQEMEKYGGGLIPGLFGKIDHTSLRFIPDPDPCSPHTTKPCRKNYGT